MITASEIDRACEEGESNRLDFKSELYPFEKASDYQKSELLKDILAFANARRSAPAFILCGVKKNDFGAMYVAGIPSNVVPDEASIQEFVNRKLNKELPFHAYSVKCAEDRYVWVIEIDVCLSDRPYYLKSAFGKLPQYCVPIRQGSSTRFATPDDVYKMAMEKQAAESIADFEISIRTRPTGRNQEIFAFDLHSDMQKDDGRNRLFPAWGPNNYDEYIYLRDWLSHIPIMVDLKNTSTVCAEDICVKIAVESADNIARICGDAPRPPVSVGSAHDAIAAVSVAMANRTLCAGDCAEKVKTVYLVAEASGEATIVVTVFCKQLKVPVVRRFPVRIALAKLEISAEYVNLITTSKNRRARYGRFLKCLLDACNEVSNIDHVDWRRVVHVAVHSIFEAESRG